MINVCFIKYFRAIKLLGNLVLILLSKIDLKVVLMNIYIIKKKNNTAQDFNITFFKNFI